MARTDTLGNFLTDVADAIREKKGTSESIQASDFDTEIANLPSGGGLDWSAIGYSDTPQSIVDDYNYSKEIYDNWVPATSLQAKFEYNTNLVYMPLVDTSITTSMNRMFSGCTELTTVPLLNTSNVSSMSTMFNGCKKLKIVPLLDTSNVINMSYMFSGCLLLTTVPSLNTSKVTSMENMFYGCTELTTVPLLSTSKTISFYQMFGACSKLSDESLDNILQMCINTTSAYTDTKVLRRLGLSSTTYPASKIETLPHYQDFINAGWAVDY